MKLHLEIRRNPCKIASAGRVDSCPVLFQVLIYNLFFTDSCHVLFQVLIRNPIFVGRRDSCSGLFQELISDLFEKER